MPSTRSPDKNASNANADPVTEMRFRVRCGSIVIGRFREFTGMGAEWETKDYPEGGVNTHVHKLPTRVKYTNVVLKRGVTHESALLDWFADTQKKGFPRSFQELTIDLMGPGGVTVRSWAFTDAYPVKWTGPNMNASSNQIATESLEMIHKGFREA
jgi:phage tail-like protein